MGLYQLIFSVYIFASTLATSGISIAVTRLVSEASCRAPNRSSSFVLKRAFLLSLSVGFLSAALLYFGADAICTYWLHDKRAVLSLKILAPSLPFMSISSCIYGYFIARRRVSVTSGAQLFEQFVRIGVVWFFINRLNPTDIANSCSVVMLGNTLADIASCVYLYFRYLRDIRKSTVLPFAAPAIPVTRRLLSIAAPIAAGCYLTSVLRTAENLLVPNCLTQYLFSREKALSQFGMLKGMAMPILFFPSSFLSAVATLLIPEISEAKAHHQSSTLTRTTMLALRVSIMTSLLTGIIFTVFADDLGTLIYGSTEVGFYIRVLGPIMPFIYLESIVDGILKGLNQQVSTLRYNITDSIIRISMILVIVPLLGMKGFLFVMLFSNLLTTFLNMRRLLIVTKLRPNWAALLVKPVASSAAAAFFLISFVRPMRDAGLLTPLQFFLFGSALVSLIYLILLFALGCVRRNDFDPIFKTFRNNNI